MPAAGPVTCKLPARAIPLVIPLQADADQTLVKIALPRQATCQMLTPRPWNADMVWPGLSGWWEREAILAAINIPIFSCFEPVPWEWPSRGTTASRSSEIVLLNLIGDSSGTAWGYCCLNMHQDSNVYELASPGAIDQIKKATTDPAPGLDDADISVLPCSFCMPQS